ncbi:MAG: hypothetical protein V1897_17595, partial [Pseudomonadota bacterium]
IRDCQEPKRPNGMTSQTGGFKGVPMLVYQEDGAKACEVFLKQTQLLNDPAFKAPIQAFVNAIPWTKDKGQFTRSEAEFLQKSRLAFFKDIELPKEEETPVVAGDVSFVSQMIANENDEADEENEN